MARADAKEEVPNALEDYKNTAIGKLINPATDPLGPVLELIREDLEQLSLGFSEELWER